MPVHEYTGITSGDESCNLTLPSPRCVSGKDACNTRAPINYYYIVQYIIILVAWSYFVYESTFEIYVSKAKVLNARNMSLWFLLICSAAFLVKTLATLLSHATLNLEWQRISQVFSSIPAIFTPYLFFTYLWCS